MPRGVWKHIIFAWFISLAVAFLTKSTHSASEIIPLPAFSKSSLPLSISGILLTLILLAGLARLSLRICQTYALTPLVTIYSIVIFAPYACLSLHQPKATLTSILVVFSLTNFLSPGLGQAVLSSIYLLAGVFLCLPLALLFPLFIMLSALEKNISRLLVFSLAFLCGFSILIATGLMRSHAGGFEVSTFTYSGLILELKYLANIMRHSPSLYLLIGYAPFLLTGMAASISGVMRQARGFAAVLASALLLIIIFSISMHSGFDGGPLALSALSLFFPAAGMGAFAMTAMFQARSSMTWNLIVVSTFLLPAAISLVFH